MVTTGYRPHTRIMNAMRSTSTSIRATGIGLTTTALSVSPYGQFAISRRNRSVSLYKEPSNWLTIHLFQEGIKG